MKLSKQQTDLLQLLVEDASLSLEILAERLGKSRQTVGRDVKLLEDAGVIVRRTVVVDAQKIGLTTTVYILVALKTHGDGLLDQFEATVRERFPNVTECAHISGSWDLLLKFVVRDSTHLAEVQRLLTSTPNVSRTRGHPVIGAPRVFPLPLAAT